MIDYTKEIKQALSRSGRDREVIRGLRQNTNIVKRIYLTAKSYNIFVDELGTILNKDIVPLKDGTVPEVITLQSINEFLNSLAMMICPKKDENISKQAKSWKYSDYKYPNGDCVYCHSGINR